jgi:hypothetical protein
MTGKLCQANLDPLLEVRAANSVSQRMKSFVWIPIAFVLLPVGLCAQALPDAPVPAPPNPQASVPPAPYDARWNRIEQISDGQLIVVRTTHGDKVRCRFAGATNNCLFCDPPGMQSSQPGLRFDRASIVSVREAEPKSDRHPVLLTVAAVLGIAVGVAAAQGDDDRTAALAGFLTAGLVGGLGYQMIQMQRQFDGFSVGFAFQPHAFGRGAGGPRGFRPHLPIPIRLMR